MRLDPASPPETVDFNGVTYRLMGGKRRYYLSQSNSNAGRRQAKGLHVAIWEFYSGQTAPKGAHVHHKDGDQFNNEYSNLVCIPQAQHAREHPGDIDAERQRKHLASVRERAAEWHRSPEGRAWHHKIATAPKKRHESVCVNCGETFMAHQSRARYCGTRCSQQYRARQVGKWPRAKVRKL